MEQEAEPEGGPIADEYGAKLNRIDDAIAKLSGRKEMTYDQAIAEDKISETVNEVKVGDTLTKDGKKGKVVKVMDDMANVDFGNGDVYGITFSRIKGKEITKEELSKDNSYVRVSKPRFFKFKNNPNFLKVYMDYDLGPGGSSTALGKETMTGQIRRLSAEEAMRQMNDIAKKLEDNFNIEDIEVTDMENGKVQIFAVSDDFIDWIPVFEVSSISELSMAFQKK